MEVEKSSQEFDFFSSSPFFKADYLNQDISSNENYIKWYKSLKIHNKNSSILYCPFCFCYYLKSFEPFLGPNQCPCCKDNFCFGCNHKNKRENFCFKARIKYCVTYIDFDDYSHFFFFFYSFSLFLLFCIFFFPFLLAFVFLGYLVFGIVGVLCVFFTWVHTATKFLAHLC